MTRLATTLVLALLAVTPAIAKENPTREPANRKGDGKVYAWKTKDGLEYEYCVPKSYDPEKGAPLLVSFHGSNLSKGWTFWNHKAGDFSPDRIIVSPDGTTPNGSGGFNFLDGKKDLQRAKALIEEIRDTFKVTQVFLYGHSQGSFFIQHLVGAYPDLADGVCAHASGVWTHTSLGPKGHRIAIGILHGSADPVVPYGQSRGANFSYRERKYPMVNFTTWFGGNHWPNAYHTARVLAWCEGMTSEDPERVDAMLDLLADDKEPGHVHWSGLWAVANRVTEWKDAPGDLKARAEKLRDGVNDLAGAHAEAMAAELKKDEPGPWVVRLNRFLDDFEGVPARDEFADKQERVLERHRKGAIAGFRDYYRKRGSDPADAFAAGVKGFSEGYTWWECAEVFDGLSKMAEDAKKLGLDRRALALYERDVAWYGKAVEKGNREYEQTNRKVKLR